MANWTNPTISTAYTTFLSEMKARDDDAAQMFDVGTPTNVPTGAIKLAKASGVFQQWNGSSWATVQLKSGAIENAAITGPLIAANAVSAANLASGAAASNLGFTPANKAGDTFTGAISLSSNAPQLSFIEADNANKTWLWYLNAGTLGLYEDTTGSPRITLAAGASTLALSAGNAITYNGQTIWHAGNDGTGTGLDADTVDGQHLGTGATAQFAALGIGIANDGTNVSRLSATSMPSNSARQTESMNFSNTTQTLTGNRTHHGLVSYVQNNHFDASGFTLDVLGEEHVVTSGGAGVSARANNLIGARFIAQNSTNQATNNVVTNGYGVVGQLKSTNANALITTGYGVAINIDAVSASGIGTAWLGHFSYSGTQLTNRRGLRVIGEDWSQFDGSLGLGVQPTQKLHVSGNALLTGTLTAGSQVFGGGSQPATAPDFSFTGDADTGLRRTAADTIALVTNQTDRITISSTGLVGINTAPATYQLSVSGSLNATTLNEGGATLSSTYAQLRTSNSFTVGDQTITVSGVGPASRLQSTDATDQDWQALILDRQSATPAASDYLASIQWYGRNTGAQARSYGAIVGQIVDATAGNEDGRLGIWTYVAGSTGLRAYVEQGLVVGSPAGWDKGTGSLNAQTIYWNGTSLAGKQTIILPWSAFWGRATNPAGTVTFETATNKITVKGWAFDPVTAEFIQTQFSMPKSWDKGSLAVTIRGFRNSGSGTSAAYFEARAAIIDPGDAADIALGSPIGVTITPSTTNQIQWQGTMSGVTPSGSTASANSTLILEIKRDPANGADADATNDFIITDVIISYGTTAPTDD